MRINTNIAALNTYNQYTVNNNAASKSVEKLSSGLRINNAADDAAGLAISEKMRSQIRGLSQSSRNAQDGISMVQTAEGALDETEQILQRMRELSVEAANDTYTDDDKAAIQSEIEQLVQEIDRISTDTEFNNKKLLNGSLENKSTAGGTNTANITGVEMSDDSLATGLYTVSVSGVSTTYSPGDVNETNIDTVTAGTGDISPGQYTVDLEATGNTDEYTVTLKDKDGNTVAETTSTINNAAADDTVDVGGVTLTWTNGGGTSTVAEGETIVDVETDATFTLQDSGGNTLKSVTVTDNTTGEVEVGGLKLTFDDTLAAGADTEVSVINNSVTFQIGANARQTMSVGIDEMSAKALDVDDIDITTNAGATAAIDSIDDAINAVSAQRAKLGAVQNRLDHTINNLTTSEENLTAAESRIRDVDIAKEMMTYTTKNILQQTAQSMLAQANQQPQNVLSLLK